MLRRAGRDWNRARATKRPRSQATSNLLSLRDALHRHPACDEGTESATAHKVAWCVCHKCATRRRMVSLSRWPREAAAAAHEEAAASPGCAVHNTCAGVGVGGSLKARRTEVVTGRAAVPRAVVCRAPLCCAPSSRVPPSHALSCAPPKHCCAPRSCAPGVARRGAVLRRGARRRAVRS